MDYGTAKILSLIGLIFIGIQVASVLLLSLVMVLQFIALGALLSEGSADQGSVICCSLLFLGFGLLIMVPAICMKLAWDIHEKIKFTALDDRDKTKMIWLIVLAFLGGGGVVPAIMYILIIASWDELTRRPARRYY